MESFERLELSFFSLPHMRISTSIIAPDGTKIVQSSFEGFECPTEWITTLKAMAAAARNAHPADGNEIRSPAAATSSSPNPDGSKNRGSLLRSSGKKRCAPAPRQPQRRPKDLQKAGACSGALDTPSSQFPNASSELAANRLPTTPGPSFNTNVQGILSPNAEIDVGQLSQSNGLCQPTIAAIEQPDIQSITISSPCLVKRAQKLEALLETIKNEYVPDREDFNNTVRRLYQHSSASHQPVTSMEQFGHMLGRLGSMSCAVGIVYSLLCWEIFRWEEDRLVRDEGKALLVAAKRVRQHIFSNHQSLTL